MNDFVPHTLVLVRHSKASHEAATDRLRPLTARGLRLADELGRELVRRVASPDLMLVSPATRAQQTAERLSGRLHPDHVRTEEAIYTSGPSGWIGLLNTVPESATSVMVVGHEPTVSALSYALHVPSGAGGVLDPADAGDSLARQIAFGVSTATAVIMTAQVPWAQLGHATCRLSSVVVAPR